MWCMNKFLRRLSTREDRNFAYTLWICKSVLAVMMTSSNGNIFRVTGLLCGEFTGHRWIPPQRSVTRNNDVFIDMCLNKRLSKQSWGWWFVVPLCPLWSHCNVMDSDQRETYSNHLQPHSLSRISTVQDWELTNWSRDKLHFLGWKL